MLKEAELMAKANKGIKNKTNGSRHLDGGPISNDLTSDNAFSDNGLENEKQTLKANHKGK